MTIMDMLGQSGTLTLLGMGVVFGFLLIMVVAVTLAGKIIHALGLDKDTTGATKAAASTAAQSTAVAAAITAAVTEYRKDEEGAKHA